MALPAVKGVIIVGGVAVALGVALYEHEPFRAWARDRWRDTNEAFEDLLNDLAPQRRRAHQFGDSSSPQSGADRPRRDFSWGFRRGRPAEARQPEQASASGRQPDLQPASAVRRRKGSGGEFGIPLDEMSARAVSEEAILDQAGPDSSRQSLDGDHSTPSTLAHDDTQAQVYIDDEGRFQTFPKSRQTSEGAEEDRAMLTPSTSTGALSEMGTEDGSLQIVHTPTSTRLGSEADPFDDDDEDIRSHTTETMSQVSAMSAEGDDRMSMASSWSQVSEAGDVHPHQVANA